MGKINRKNCKESVINVIGPRKEKTEGIDKYEAIHVVGKKRVDERKLLVEKFISV